MVDAQEIMIVLMGYDGLIASVFQLVRDREAVFVDLDEFLQLDGITPAVDRINNEMGWAVLGLEADREWFKDFISPDVAEFGACYCRLYVNKTVFESKNLPEVPERRPLEKQGRAYGLKNVLAPAQEETKPSSAIKTQPAKNTEVKKKLWYCKQCGYVVYREDPPYVCPICKAKKEMFAKVEANIEFKG